MIMKCHFQTVYKTTEKRKHARRLISIKSGLQFPLKFSEILQAHPKNKRSQTSRLILMSIPASKCNAVFKIIQDCIQLKFRQSKAVHSQQYCCVHSQPKKKACTPSCISHLSIISIKLAKSIFQYRLQRAYNVVH